jgi:hypothetical protein
MQTYWKVYNIVSKIIFVLHCAYFVYTAVSLFFPLFTDGETLAEIYCTSWTIIIPILSLGALGFSAWCALKSPESPLVALGTGVFTYVGYVIMYIIPVTGWVLGNMFADDGLQVAGTLLSRVSDDVFYATLNMDVVFIAYSIVTFLLDMVKPIKKD